MLFYSPPPLGEESYFPRQLYQRQIPGGGGGGCLPLCQCHLNAAGIQNGITFFKKRKKIQKKALLRFISNISPYPLPCMTSTTSSIQVLCQLKGQKRGGWVGGGKTWYSPEISFSVFFWCWFAPFCLTIIYLFISYPSPSSNGVREAGEHFWLSWFRQRMGAWLEPPPPIFLAGVTWEGVEKTIQ